VLDQIVENVRRIARPRRGEMPIATLAEHDGLHGICSATADSSPSGRNVARLFSPERTESRLHRVGNRHFCLALQVAPAKTAPGPPPLIWRVECGLPGSGQDTDAEAPRANRASYSPVNPFCTSDWVIARRGELRRWRLKGLSAGIGGSRKRNRRRPNHPY